MQGAPSAVSCQQRTPITQLLCARGAARRGKPAGEPRVDITGIDIKARRGGASSEPRGVQMNQFNGFGFGGRRALVVGGATGMGAAVAQLLVDAGAQVVAMDCAPITLAGATALHVDLAQRDSIDAGLDACGGSIDALFSCSGVADGTAGIERINFIGHRHLIEGMLDRGMLGRGSAIAMISSAAGLGWESNLEALKQLLAIHDWDAAVTWFTDHGKADYMTTKQAVCAYVATEAFPMLQRGIRINALCPGPTDTPLAQANAERWFAMGTDYRTDTGTELSTPFEQALPLLFLCSAAAAAVNGQTLVSDAGYLASGLAGSYPSAVGPAQLFYGRVDLAKYVGGHT
jgi:NAD(P)-dependent dehydrogenase (short-subunit alcohol dehydrogenase family)